MKKSSDLKMCRCSQCMYGLRNSKHGEDVALRARKKSRRKVKRMLKMGIVDFDHRTQVPYIG